MGGERARAPRSPSPPSPPTVILMAGLQGSGKTAARVSSPRACCAPSTTARSRSRPATCSAPLRSSSSSIVGEEAGAAVYEQGIDRSPVDIAGWALERARSDGKDVLIVDTAGRLHVDSDLMDELVAIRDAVAPTRSSWWSTR